MQTPQNDAPLKPFAGLYLRTPGQTRFWGWSSRGWVRLHSTAAPRPVKNLAAWLRQAHAELDDPGANEAPSLTPHEHDARQSPHEHRKLQFVCNRRMIGLLFR